MPETVRQKAQNFALGHFLTEYPLDATFEEVLEMVRTESGKVCPVDPYFFNTSDDALVDLITCMATALEAEFDSPPRKVLIVVNGGVADVLECPDDVTVTIRDFDNDETTVENERVSG